MRIGMRHVAIGAVALSALALPWTRSLAAQESRHVSEWEEDGRRVRVEVVGRVVFAADDRSVESLSPGGRMTIEEEPRSGRERRLEYRARGGGVERTYYEEGREAAVDADAAAWLRSILPEVIRQSGIGAEERIARIHRDEGVDGVLREIDLIRSDGARRRYYSILLEGYALDPEELARLLQGVGEEMASDGDKARLLRLVAERSELADEPVRSAFFGASGTIDSDGDHQRVLAAVLRRHGKNPGVLLPVLRSARGIASDGDLSRLLLMVPGALLRDEGVAAEFVETMRTIESDGDMSRVAMHLLESRT